MHFKKGGKRKLRVVSLSRASKALIKPNWKFNN